MAAEQWFRCLYTKHKTRKSKVYQDGFIAYQSTSRKANLHDEGKSLLDTAFFKALSEGDDVEFPGFLVTVDEPLHSDKSGSSTSAAPSKEKGNETLSTSSRPFGAKAARSSLLRRTQLSSSLPKRNAERTEPTAAVQREQEEEGIRSALNPLAVRFSSFSPFFL